MEYHGVRSTVGHQVLNTTSVQFETFFGAHHPAKSVCHDFVAVTYMAFSWVTTMSAYAKKKLLRLGFVLSCCSPAVFGWLPASLANIAPTQLRDGCWVFAKA